MSLFILLETTRILLFSVECIHSSAFIKHPQRYDTYEVLLPETIANITYLLPPAKPQIDDTIENSLGKLLIKDPIPGTADEFLKFSSWQNSQSNS